MSILKELEPYRKYMWEFPDDSNRYHGIFSENCRFKGFRVQKGFIIRIIDDQVMFFSGKRFHDTYYGYILNNGIWESITICDNGMLSTMKTSVEWYLDCEVIDEYFKELKFTELIPRPDKKGKDWATIVLCDNDVDRYFSDEFQNNIIGLEIRDGSIIIEHGLTTMLEIDHSKLSEDNKNRIFTHANDKINVPENMKVCIDIDTSSKYRVNMINSAIYPSTVIRDIITDTE